MTVNTSAQADIEIPTTDVAAVRSHIEMIHSLACTANVDGILVLASFDEKGSSIIERFGIGDSERMISAAISIGQYRNVYAPWAVFRRDLESGKKGSENDIRAVLAFVGDIDSDTGKSGRKLPIDPPYVVETSAGNFQPVFPLATAIPPAAAKPVAQAFSAAIGGDFGTKDLCHVWRIPGTLNLPTKTKLARGRSAIPQLVKIAMPWTGELISLDAIRSASEAFNSAKEQPLSAESGIGGDFSELPAGLKKLIASPPYAGEDQSETAAAVFSHLRRLGWSSDQIEAVVNGHPAGIGRRYADGKDLRADIERTGQKYGTGAVIDPVDLWAKFEPPSLPRGVLPEVIERFAFDQGRAMGADIAGVAVSALAVCAAAIPDKIQLQVKRHNIGWLESARLWVALVGPPSTMKSPILSAAVRPLRKIDSRMAQLYSEARSKYDKLPTDERKQTDPPKQTRLLLQDTTIEAAQEIIKDSPDGMLCYQDEMSGWFGSMDKYSNARGSAKDRAFWLEAYNGAPYSVNRVGRGAVHIDNLSVSMLGGIQPEPIRKLADDSTDDGLLQRILPVILRPAVEGRDEPDTAGAQDYAELINWLHDRENLLTGGGAIPAVLRFDDGAQTLRQELERKHLEFMSCESVNRKLAAHIGKYNGIFARLCVVWHCVENPKGDLPALVSEATARRAAGFLHGFLLPHALAFYAGTLGLSDDHDRLTAVAGYILAHKLDRITNRDVQRGDRTMRGLGRAEIAAVFDQLSALGWIDRAPGPRPSDLPHWAVNPAVHARFADRAQAETARRERDRTMIAGMFKRAG